MRNNTKQLHAIPNTLCSASFFAVTSGMRAFIPNGHPATMLTTFLFYFRTYIIADKKLFLFVDFNKHE